MSGAYAVRLERPAQKALKALAKGNRAEHDRVVASLRELEKEPRPDGCKALQGPHKGKYRVRVGDQRVVYYVIDRDLVVRVVAIGDRKDVYG